MHGILFDRLFKHFMRQCDKELVMAAVSQNPSALEHVDDALKHDAWQSIGLVIWCSTEERTGSIGSGFVCESRFQVGQAIWLFVACPGSS